MNKLLIKLKSRESLIFLTLVVLCFLANFAKLRSFGIYGDDWAAGTYLYQHSTLGAAQGWVAWRGEIDNFRPLAILLPIFWYWGYSIFKLSGVFIVIALIYSLMYCLSYKILKLRTSSFVAFVATVIFILYPTNNFYVWQVATTYALSLVFVFSAVLFYWQKKFIPAFLFLIASALINEATLFVFVVALLPEKKVLWQEAKKSFLTWFKFVSGLILIYGGSRVFLEYFHLVKGGRLAYSLKTFSLVGYIFQFFKSIFVVLVSSWGFAAWKVFNNFQFEQLFLAICVLALVCAGGYLVAGGKLAPSNLKFPGWYLLLAGLAVICAGRYYGFYYVPSINILNLDSRYYFASSFGGVLFAAGIMEIVLSNRFARFKSIFISLFLGLVLFLAIFRLEVQIDAVNAWSEARSLWQQTMLSIPSLNPGELAIIKMPSRVLGKIVEATPAVPDPRIFFPKIYGQRRLGFLSNYIQNQDNTGQQICITSAPFFDNACFDKDKLYVFTWDGALLTPHGKAALLLSREKQQQIPKNLADELNKINK